MKKLFSILAMLVIAATVLAGNVVSMTTVSNNVINNGVSSLKISVSFDADGMNHSFRPIVLIYDRQDDNAYHKDTNGINATNTGCVCATGETIVGPYATNRIDKTDIFLPLSEVHPYTGTRTYYAKVWILDVTTNQYICSGQFIPFEITNN